MSEYMRMAIWIVVIAVLCLTINGCSKFFDMKEDARLQENSVEDDTEVKNDVSIDDVGNGIDDEIELLKEIVLEDGSKMMISEEAIPYVEEYKRLNEEIESSGYPQEQSVKLNKEYDYETTIDSSFKVSNIAYKTVKYSDKSQAMLDADITGSIAGLDGKYTISIPYEKAIKLKVGDAFAINYQTIRLNGRVVITNIKY